MNYHTERRSPTVEQRSIMISRPDILIRSKDERPVAIVEVKNPREWSETLATEMRRNMIMHDMLLPAPYLLLVSQRKGFVWRQTDDASDHPERPPDAEFPMDHVVARYVPAGLSDRWLRGRELEFIVLRWLDDLASGIRREDSDAERALIDIGFLQAIADASVLPEAVL